jgi:hypothetical protein
VGLLLSHSDNICGYFTAQSDASLFWLIPASLFGNDQCLGLLEMGNLLALLADETPLEVYTSCTWIPLLSALTQDQQIVVQNRKAFMNQTQE